MDELNIIAAKRLPSRPKSTKRYERPLKRRIRSRNPDTVGIYNISGLKFKRYGYICKRRYDALNVFIRTNRSKT